MTRSAAVAIRPIHESDLRQYISLRLEALRDHPAAFASSYEDQRNDPDDIATGDLHPTFDEHGTPHEYTRSAGRSLVKQLYRYGSARLEATSEEKTLKDLDEAFAAKGYQLRPLLLELTSSDGFRYTVEGAQQ